MVPVNGGKDWAHRPFVSKLDAAGSPVYNPPEEQEAD
jgi:hypothetical protein